jgi:hypothetical protein
MALSFINADFGLFAPGLNVPNCIPEWRTAMKRYGISLIVSVALLLVLGGVCMGDDLMNPTDFSQKVRRHNNRQAALYPDLRVNLSIARVNDNQPVDSAFGQKEGGQELAAVKTDGTAVVTVKNKEHYDTRKDEVGYGKKVREMMAYYLSSIKSIQLVEREDINAIIRELDFSDSGYAKTKAIPEVEMPQYIAKGFMSANDGSCISDDSPQWNPSSASKDGKPLMFLIRVYDTHTSFVKYIACGTGQDRSEAVKQAVDNLDAHMDRLYPDVAVLKVSDNQVVLSGGRKQGLAPGTRFYLLRSQGSKAAVDYTDLNYVAQCKIIAAQLDRATAVIQKTYADEAPEIGDWVFFYRDQSGW